MFSASIFYAEFYTCYLYYLQNMDLYHFFQVKAHCSCRTTVKPSFIIYGFILGFFYVKVNNESAGNCLFIGEKFKKIRFIYYMYLKINSWTYLISGYGTTTKQADPISEVQEKI